MEQIVRRTFALGAVLVAGLFAACDRTTEPSPSKSTPTPSLTSDESIDALVRMGFARNAIVKDGRNFVVEGDMSVTPEWIQSQVLGARQSVIRGMAPRFQYISYYPRTLAQAGNITVNLSGWSGRPDLQAAMRAAMEAWNTIGGSSIQFNEVFGSPANVTVDTMNQACTFYTSPPSISCTLAVAELPSGTDPKQVKWNVPADTLHYLDVQKTFALVHELGHIIGFRHADVISDGNFNHVYLSPINTDAESYNSVMTHTTRGRGWGDWDYWDVYAADREYPAPAPFINDASEHSTAHPEFNWTTRSEISHYWIYYHDPALGFGNSQLLAYITGSSFIDTLRVTTATVTCTSTTPSYTIVAENSNGTTTLESNKICYNHETPPTELFAEVYGPDVVAPGYGYSFMAVGTGGTGMYYYAWSSPTSETTQFAFGPVCSSGYVSVQVYDGHQYKTASKYVTVSDTVTPPQGADMMPCF